MACSYRVSVLQWLTTIPTLPLGELGLAGPERAIRFDQVSKFSKQLEKPTQPLPRPSSPQRGEVISLSRSWKVT